MNRSLHGVRMNVTKTAASGVVNSETIFEFSELDGVIEARYAGGGVVRGYLIGRRAADRIEFRYVQLTDGGVLDGGHSHCDLEAMENGRLRLIEHFEWASREGEGTTVFAEMRDG